MNKYESIIIINPSVDEEKVNELTTKFTDMINEDGKVYDFFKTYIEIIKKNGALNKCRVPTKKL